MGRDKRGRRIVRLDVGDGAGSLAKQRDAVRKAYEQILSVAVGPAKSR